MLDYGADGLILEGSEAGGHIGHVSTVVLLQEILFQFGEQVPIFVAGGIGTGKLIAHLGLMGAAGAQMGTRFVMAEECRAHQRFKDVFIKARAREAISTPQYSNKLPVVAVRALANQAMSTFGELQLELLRKLQAGEIGRQEAQYEVEHFWVGSLREAAVEGNVEKGSLMAGQSVGLCQKVQPLREILEELVHDIDAAIAAAEVAPGRDRRRRAERGRLAAPAVHRAGRSPPRPKNAAGSGGRAPSGNRRLALRQVVHRRAVVLAVRLPAIICGGTVSARNGANRSGLDGERAAAPRIQVVEVEQVELRVALVEGHPERLDLRAVQDFMDREPGPAARALAELVAIHGRFLPTSRYRNIVRIDGIMKC